MVPSNGDSSDDIQNIINSVGLGSPDNGQGVNDNSSAAASQQQQAQQQQQGDGSAANQQIFDEAAYEKRLSDMYGLDSASLKARLDEANSLKELVDAPAYKTPLGKGMDELMAKGIAPDAAIKYLSTDFEKMDNREFMAMQMVLNNGLTTEEALRYIDRKYSLGDFKKSDEDEKDGLLTLKVDAAAVRPQTQELKNKMLELGRNRDTVAAEQANASRLANWGKEIQKLKTEFSEIKLPIGTTKDGKPRMELPFKLSNSETIFKEIETLVQRMPELQTTQAGIEFVKKIATDRAIISNLPTVLSTILTHGRSQNNQWWDSILNNPDFGQSPANHTGALPSTDQQIAEGIAKALGG